MAVEPKPPNPVLVVEPKPVAGLAAVLPKIPPPVVAVLVCPKPPLAPPRLDPKPVEPKGLAAERGDCVVAAVDPKMLVPVAAGWALKLKGDAVVAAV